MEGLQDQVILPVMAKGLEGLFSTPQTGGRGVQPAGFASVNEAGPHAHRAGGWATTGPGGDGIQALATPGRARAFATDPAWLGPFEGNGPGGREIQAGGFAADIWTSVWALEMKASPVGQRPMATRGSRRADEEAKWGSGGPPCH